jgi:hypothetical protein
MANHDAEPQTPWDDGLPGEPDFWIGLQPGYVSDPAKRAAELGLPLNRISREETGELARIERLSTELKTAEEADRAAQEAADLEAADLEAADREAEALDRIRAAQDREREADRGDFSR